VAKQRTQHLPTLLQEEFITESLRQPPAASMDVFISYSRADSDLARKLNDALQIQGKTTWFDQESIASGSDFQQEIYRGIKACDNFLFILSPRSVTSPYCADEVEYAAQLHKRFITLLHREVNSAILHPELAKVQWIDFNQNGGDFNANFNQLVRTLDTDREYVHSHTKWLQRALEWQEKDRSADLLLRGSEVSLAQNWLQEAEQKNKQPAATDLQKAFIRASSDAIFAQLKQEKRRVVMLRSLLGLVSIGFLVSVGVGWMAVQTQRKAQRGEIEALEQSSEARFALGQQFDALLTALKAAKQLKAAGWDATDPNLRAQVVSRLQQSIYGLKELNRLESHKGSIADASFSPDSQTIATIGSNDKTVKLWRRDGSLISNKTFEKSENLAGSGTFSPDGQMIVTATKDKKVKLWQRDGTFISTLEDKQGLSGNAIFSPDSQTIATSSSDNKTVKLWQRDGKLLSTLKAKDAQYLNLYGERSFSPNGQIIATVSYDKTVKLYIVKLWRRNGTVITTFKGQEEGIQDISFSPNGQIIAVTNSDNTVKLWGLKGKLITTLPHDKWVQSVKFSPDGQTIATVSNDGMLRLWRPNGTRRITIKGHEGDILDVSFSPDSQTIATASADKTVKLWRLDGTPLATFTGHNDYVRKARFSPDGQMLISVSDDKTVKLWNPDNHFITAIESANAPTFFTNRDQTWGEIFATTVENGPVKLWKADGTSTPIATPIQKSEGTMDVNFFNKGQTLVTTVNKEKQFYGPVQLWKADGTPIATLIKKTPSKSSVGVGISDQGQTIATTISDENSYGPVQLWKADGTPIATLIKKTSSQGSVWVYVSNDGQTIATTISDENSYGPVQLWKANGTPITTLIKKTSSKDSVSVNLSFSDDGQTIATTISDENSYGPVQLWKANGTPIVTLIQKTQSKGRVNVSFSKDSQTLLTTIYDENSYSTVKLWKADGTFVKTLIEKSQESPDVSFSKDSQTVVTSVNDGPIKLWKANGTLIATLTEKSQGQTWINDFSPDNKTVALQNQKTITLWNLDGSKTDIPTGHKGDISTVLFSPNGRIIATASYDNTVKLWERNGTPITTLTHRAGVTSLNFSADGKILTSVDQKNTVMVRHLEGMTTLEDLLAKGCQWMGGYLQKSPNLEESDRQLCDGIATRK
jgi:WD40 repeat protein